MALTRMTLDEIVARAAKRTPEEDAEFRRRMDATTEDDIRRHMIEDGEDPDEEPQFERPVLPQDVRKKLGTEPLRHGARGTDSAEADRPRAGGGAACAAWAGRRLSHTTSQLY